MWPSWDLLEAPKDPFSIEREARLHRQAAGEWAVDRLGFEASFWEQGKAALGHRRVRCL